MSEPTLRPTWFPWKLYPITESWQFSSSSLFDDDFAATTTAETTAIHTIRRNIFFKKIDDVCAGDDVIDDCRWCRSPSLSLLRTIHNSLLESLRAGNGMETTLMSDEERRFMWNLAFSFTIAHRGAAFKAYYAIRSFITFHGIFMAPGYGVGDKSVWNSE